MKILEIIHALTPGGAERLVVDLCNEMSKTEEVTLLSLKDLSQGNNGFYLNDVCDRVKVEDMKLSDGFHICHLFKVWKKIHAIHPDIVHHHLAANRYAVLATMFHPAHVKVFGTIHNDVKKSYSSGFNRLEIKILGKLGLKKYVTISKTNFNDFQMMYPTVSNTLICNGRNLLYKTDEFLLIQEKVEKLKNDGDSLVLLHIARCSPQKNQQLLIKAFNKWIANGANAILLIIGAGFESEYGKALQKESCPQVKFLGTTPHIADYMHCSDAFVLSSSYEGMPITAIESLMAGLPILSTPVCGIVDVVRHKENGLLTRDWSEEQFVKMLNDFENEHKTMKEVAKKESVDSPYTIQKCAAGYLALFSKGLAS